MAGSGNYEILPLMRVAEFALPGTAIEAGLLNARKGVRRQQILKFKGR